MFDVGRGFSIEFQCREDEDYDSIMANGGEPFACGSRTSAYVFFILFQLICSQMFLNLFIAIIAEAFLGQTYLFNSPVQSFHVQDFEAIWYRFDPKATGFIKLEELDALILALSESEDASHLIVIGKTMAKDERNRARLIA
mmetsp:Transcript_9882/g.11711  ORF Transcript_9882/g.11711 Transcript_9882/m.11711 type:complete len:141 (-) Transcript_9882:798-1220(-)